MKWYFTIAGGHTHVRVFMNGGKCGDLCFRNEEFIQVREHCPWISFLTEPSTEEKMLQAQQHAVKLAEKAMEKWDEIEKRA